MVYSIFNFDDKHNLNFKINFIKSYYTENSFIEGIIINVLWTLGVLVLTYLILNLSRVIVNTSEKQIKPWVYKLTDSKSIVLKSTYENIRNERDELQTRLDKERESKSKLEIRINSLEEEILERDRAVAEREGEESLNSKNDKTDSQPNEIEQLYYKIKSQGLLDKFLDDSVLIKKDEYVDDSESNDSFLELGLIEFKEHHWDDRPMKKYSLTSDGKHILKYHRSKD